VRVEGLEPPRLAALEPKSSASTNFATPAFWPLSSKGFHQMREEKYIKIKLVTKLRKFA
jgi:hypothetical protein